ncbi:uncharacterized protein LOC124860697 isoform X1 [Girardinichthys multiradiatus]|uniref:uncharacterized protein LOC124860697 isoform X1 n=1 Tax=Girardinichthys multiradiatus TaxID=208333 RepID=UPI001FACEB88|nr:uncharacterized protein LOC124860697 isoform X1 [Girardinichthys multiradiatus]XP_047210159.1 uncharacterized protein LOC124860697 isoform X1 [Girardinichthys multiradiatus]XP_047210160.1 uncharacterized protein LOC124860697 isoform X1 [Girardinichthys multiradiatus]XP_047210161.1 uncharacterized protein LOC124860697 isoform X1 [Girardinichthys multiradiatus]
MYSCPKCGGTAFKDVKNVIWHLREIHCLSDGQNIKIICGQDSCPRTYYNLNLFSKHLHRAHFEMRTKNITVVQPLYPSEASNSMEQIHNIPDNLDTPKANVDMVATPQSENCVDLSNCAGSFVAQMYSSSNMTVSDVMKSVNCAKELINRTVDSLQQSTTTLLKGLQVPSDSDATKALIKEFEDAKHIFDDLDTQYKMNKYFMEKFSLVKPKEIFLGHRCDTARKNGQIKQVLVADTCQYISITETLMFLFEHEEMQNLFLLENKSTDNKLRDYCDGSHFSTHPLFQKSANALQMQLYFDDLETTNPLGSKTKIHKLGAMYFTIRNLQIRLQFNTGQYSSVSSVQLN